MRKQKPEKLERVHLIERMIVEYHDGDVYRACLAVIHALF